jgi:hypothetical protein
LGVAVTNTPSNGADAPAAPIRSAADLIPVWKVLSRASISRQQYHTLVREGKAPAPVKGVLRSEAIAWLKTRGVTDAPAGDLIPLGQLLELTGVLANTYLHAVRRGKAPRQIKGVRKGQALAWLAARAAVAAAKARLAVVSAPRAEGSASP